MEHERKQAISAEDNALLDAVCASAHQIWQAGLGAFARARKEGGDLFDRLVREGGELHELTQRVDTEKGLSVTDTVTRLAESASRQASGSLDKLERVFEDRVLRSLRSLGVPSSADIQALGHSVAELKAALHAVGTRSQEDVDALRQALVELKASVAGNAGPPRAGAKPQATTKQGASATASPKRAVSSPPAMSKAAKSTATKRKAAKGAAAKRSAPRKTTRSASRSA